MYKTSLGNTPPVPLAFLQPTRSSPAFNVHLHQTSGLFGGQTAIFKLLIAPVASFSLFHGNYRMAIFNTLPESINEVDVIVAGGQRLSTHRRPLSEADAWG